MWHTPRPSARRPPMLPRLPNTTVISGWCFMNRAMALSSRMSLLPATTSSEGVSIRQEASPGWLMVLAAIHCSTRCFGNSHLPVTLVAGMRCSVISL